METLYIIGKGTYAVGTRLSPDPALNPAERVWAVLTAEKVQPFIDVLDEDLRERGIGIGEGHYDTSPHSVVHYFLHDGEFAIGCGALEFALEVRDLDLPGSTLTLVRRATPTKPKA